MLTDRSRPFTQISCWAISYRRTVAITGLRCEPCVGGVHSSFLAGGVLACLGLRRTSRCGGPVNSARLLSSLSPNCHNRVYASECRCHALSLVRSTFDQQHFGQNEFCR